MRDLPQNFYQNVLENLYDGVYYVNRQGYITYWNKAAENITGFNREEVLGKKCSDNLLRHIDENGTCLCLHGCPLLQTMEDGQPRVTRAYLHTKGGHRLPVSVRVAPMLGHTRKITGAVEIFSDNSNTVAALQRLKELEDLAYLDTLTGIANRRYLETFLAGKLNELRRYGWSFGVILADVDTFKQLNDTHGHLGGDLVLKMVAQNLAKNCRSFDLAGRWGGDEFLSVIAHLREEEQLRSAAERVRRLVEHSWISFHDATLKATLSLGATLGRPEDTWESILERADRLLYQSKAAGNNRVTLG